MPDFGDHSGDGASRHDVFGTVDPFAPSVANGQITPAQWAEYQRKRKKAAILGVASTIGGMLLAGPAANFITGGGGAAAAGAGSSAAPAAAPVAAPGIFSGASLGAPAATAAGTGTAAGTAAVGGKMAGSSLVSKMLPILIGAGADGISAVAQSRSSRKAREADERLARDKMAQDRDLEEMGLALEESQLDPFRHLLAQVAAGQALDRVANYQPLDFSASPYASHIPKGGYAPSDELRSAAGSARTTALSGQGANTPVTAKATPPAIMDLIANSRPPGKSPVSSTMPIGQAPSMMPALPQQGAPSPVNRMPDIDNFGLTAAVDPMAGMMPSYMPQQQRRPPMRRARPRARMTVAA